MRNNAPDLTAELAQLPLLILGTVSTLLPWDLNSPLGTTGCNSGVVLGELEMQILRLHPGPTEPDSLGVGVGARAAQQDFKMILEDTKV